MGIYDVKYLEREFTADKVKGDLCAFYEISDYGIVEIGTANFDGLSEKILTFSHQDNVFVYAIRTVKRYDGLFFIPYIVEAIIGDFEISEQGIFQNKKFKVQILYDFDFEIKTIDYDS